MKTVLTLLRKDLLLELRTLETVPAMILFSVVTFVIFHFALNRDTIDGQLAAGVLTATLLFASMLAINRLFVAEREQGGFDAFLLAPVERNALLVAKAGALFAVPGRARADRDTGVWPAAAWARRSGPIAARIDRGAGARRPGIAVIGTLVSAIAVHTRARDLIGPGDRAALDDSRPDRHRSRRRAAAGGARFELAAG